MHEQCVCAQHYVLKYHPLRHVVLQILIIVQPKERNAKKKNIFRNLIVSAHTNGRDDPKIPRSMN
jgi:hypothetical protein